MKKRFAIYCSGNAGRVIKFYSKYKFQHFPVEIIFYDGQNPDVLNSLKSISRHLTVITIQKEDEKNQKEYNEKVSKLLLEHLVSKNIDYLFCFGMAILKKPLINVFKERIINFHPSLLPAFPGKNAIDQALNYGVKFIGNTAHFIDEGIDTGKIICQNILPVSEYKNYESLLSLQLPMLKELYKDFSK